MRRLDSTLPDASRTSTQLSSFALSVIRESALAFPRAVGSVGRSTVTCSGAGAPAGSAVVAGLVSAGAAATAGEDGSPGVAASVGFSSGVEPGAVDVALEAWLDTGGAAAGGETAATVGAPLAAPDGSFCAAGAAWEASAAAATGTLAAPCSDRGPGVGTETTFFGGV